ncbi:hypothetical protein GEMRC1_002998 [Eukaryota sp. GEM-RC1]
MKLLLVGLPLIVVHLASTYLSWFYTRTLLLGYTHPDLVDLLLNVSGLIPALVLLISSTHLVSSFKHLKSSIFHVFLSSMFHSFASKLLTLSLSLAALSFVSSVSTVSFLVVLSLGFLSEGLRYGNNESSFFMVYVLGTLLISWNDVSFHILRFFVLCPMASFLVVGITILGDVSLVMDGFHLQLGYLPLWF